MVREEAIKNKIGHQWDSVHLTLLTKVTESNWIRVEERMELAQKACSLCFHWVKKEK